MLFNQGQKHAHVSKKESLYTNVTQVHILRNKHLAHKPLFDLSLYRTQDVVGKQFSQSLQRPFLSNRGATTLQSRARYRCNAIAD